MLKAFWKGLLDAASPPAELVIPPERLLDNMPPPDDSEPEPLPDNVIPLHKRGISREERAERQPFRWSDHFAGRGASARPWQWNRRGGKYWNDGSWGER